MIYEALRQLAGDAFDVALKMLDGMVDHQVALLASLSAGNGMLRRLDRRPGESAAGLSGPDQAALTRPMRCSPAHCGRRWPDPDPRVVLRTARDDNQRKSRGPLHNAIDSATDPTGGLHRLILGRDVAVGVIASNTIQGTTYTGPDYFGRVSPGPFATRDHANVNPGSDAKISARLAVATANLR